MGEVLELAEALWVGETDTYAHHPWGGPRTIEQIADGSSVCASGAGEIGLSVPYCSATEERILTTNFPNDTNNFG